MHSLGLDISTSITGICILDEHGQIADQFPVRLEKFDDIHEKSDEIERIFKDLKKKYQITNIYVEESLLAFQGGASSAGVISTLAKANAIFSYIAYKQFAIKPIPISSGTARKTVGIKILKNGINAKEQAFEWVQNNVPTFRYEMTKQGNPKPGTKDAADAYIICKAGYLMNLTTQPQQ